jgi:site-specific DNA-methyltransferase (adenine-specific)
MKYTIHQGDNRDTLKTLEDNSVDAIVTDPPYGIDFLGKAWDANTGALETYRECLRVLKPGGYILAFSAARTYHHLAVTFEQAGFEIRDQLMWLYASGFPKAQDIGKAIDKRGTDNNYHGWKTALKPAHEPICMARKPFKGSTIDNVLEHGVGALNIDATRIDGETLTYPANGINRLEFNQQEPNKWQGETVTNEQGRYPSNVMGEVEGYQKFFYCPKVSRKERHIGFDTTDIPTSKGGMFDNHGTGVMYSVLNKPQTGNNHPTVKPVELMKYLIKLVTPPNSTVLDPFTGSGSTGMAAVELGHTFIGCELDPAYVEIAQRRIEAWNTEETDNNFKELFDELF